MEILSKEWIEKRANRYDETHREEQTVETRLLESIKNIRSPKYLTKDILIEIAQWKTGSGRITKNKLKAEKDDEYIEAVTKKSLDAYEEHNERLVLGILTLLPGVKVRMASAILYFCFPKNYTTMDWRAWESLKSFGKIDGDIKNNDNFEGWKKYNGVCSQISEQYGVSLRDLDKALWEYKGGK